MYLQESFRGTSRNHNHNTQYKCYIQAIILDEHQSEFPSLNNLVAFKHYKQPSTATTPRSGPQPRAPTPSIVQVSHSPTVRPQDSLARATGRSVHLPMPTPTPPARLGGMTAAQIAISSVQNGIVERKEQGVPWTTRHYRRRIL